MSMTYSILVSVYLFIWFIFSPSTNKARLKLGFTQDVHPCNLTMILRDAASKNPDSTYTVDEDQDLALDDGTRMYSTLTGSLVKTNVNDMYGI